MDVPSLIRSISSSLDVIASGSTDRIQNHAKSRGVKFNEHDPINLIVARLSESLSNELDVIAAIAEAEIG